MDTIFYNDQNLRTGPSGSDALYNDTFTSDDFKNKKWQKTGEIWLNAAKRNLNVLSIAVRIASVVLAFSIFTANVGSSFSHVAIMQNNFSDTKEINVLQVNEQEMMHFDYSGIEAGRKHA